MRNRSCQLLATTWPPSRTVAPGEAAMIFAEPFKNDDVHSTSGMHDGGWRLIRFPESAHPKVAGMDGAAASFVEFFYALT